MKVMADESVSENNVNENNVNENDINENNNVSDDCLTEGEANTPSDDQISVSENVVLKSNSLMASVNSSPSIGLEGKGTQSSPYLLKSYEDFTQISNAPSAYYSLDADINVAENNFVWNSITFSGSFNGNGHSIYNIKSFSGATGIFNNIDGAYISNLRCIICGEMNGASSGGIIANYSRNSTISNCFAKGNVSASSPFGGIVGSMEKTVIEQCMAQGKFSVYGRGYIDSVGGIVGTISGHKINGSEDSVVRDCVSDTELFCSSGNIVHADACAGGIVGYVSSYDYGSGYYDWRPCKIDKCLVMGTISNKEDYGFGSVSVDTSSARPIYGVFHIGPTNDWPLIVDTYYNTDLISKAPPYPNGYVAGKTTQELKLIETYAGWDFENIWGIEEGNYPFLRNINCDISNLSEGDLVDIKFTCTPEKGSNRVRVDDDIILQFADEIQILDDKSVYIRNTGDYTSCQFSMSLSNDNQTLILKPKNEWDTYAAYEIVIPANTIKNMGTNEIITRRIVYNFSTNLLTSSGDTWSVPDDGMKKIYPKNIWGQDKTEVVPFPSLNEDEYVSLFRLWAERFGYNQMYSMNDADIKKVLNYEFSAPLIGEDNSIYLQGNTNKTVMDVMRDILMVQYMKKYLINEENNLSKDLSTEKMQASVNTLCGYQNRLAQYLSENSETAYDVRTTFNVLLDVTALFVSVYDEGANEQNEKEITMNEMLQKTISVFTGFEKVSIQTDNATKDLLDKAYDATNPNTVVQEASDKLCANKIFNAIIARDSISGKINKSIKIVIKEQTFDIAATTCKKIFGVDIYSIRELYSKAKSVYNLYGSEFGGILIGCKMIYAFMETAISYLDYIENMYPSWLFYSQYYMRIAAPDRYSNIWTDNGNVSLSYGEGLFPVSEYNEESDAIVKLLMNPLCEGNPTLETGYNIYTYQDNYMSSHNNALSVIETANYLSRIRSLNQTSAAQALMLYALGEYEKHNTKIKAYTVACPTDVDIINTATKEKVFTIQNGMSFDDINMGEFGSYYLMGDNRDIKYIRLREGYEIQIVPTASGTMDCVVESLDANDVCNRTVFFESVTIATGEVYTFEDNKLKRTANLTETLIDATRIVEETGKKGNPSHDDVDTDTENSSNVSNSNTKNPYPNKLKEDNIRTQTPVKIIVGDQSTGKTEFAASKFADENESQEEKQDEGDKNIKDNIDIKNNTNPLMKEDNNNNNVKTIIFNVVISVVVIIVISLFIFLHKKKKFNG